jgi:hypothetical protein
LGRCCDFILKNPRKALQEKLRPTEALGVALEIELVPDARGNHQRLLSRSGLIANGHDGKQLKQSGIRPLFGLASGQSILMKHFVAVAGSFWTKWKRESLFRPKTVPGSGFSLRRGVGILCFLRRGDDEEKVFPA